MGLDHAEKVARACNLMSDGGRQDSITHGDARNYLSRLLAILPAMDRDLDFTLKVLKLMKYGDRAIADQPIKVVLIVFGVVTINKLLGILERWLLSRRQTCERERVVYLREEEYTQLLADQQLLRELNAAGN